eukprot:7783570-Alexandrium_andersonii.AAC.1
MQTSQLACQMLPRLPVPVLTGVRPDTTEADQMTMEDQEGARAASQVARWLLERRRNAPPQARVARASANSDDEGQTVEDFLAAERAAGADPRPHPDDDGQPPCEEPRWRSVGEAAEIAAGARLAAEARRTADQQLALAHQHLTTMLQDHAMSRAETEALSRVSAQLPSPSAARLAVSVRFSHLIVRPMLRAVEQQMVQHGCFVVNTVGVPRSDQRMGLRMIREWFLQRSRAHLLAHPPTLSDLQA